MQLLTHAFGGKVASTKQKEYGPATITHTERSPLFDSLPSELEVWMSHGDRIEEPPAGFVALAESGNAPFAAIGDLRRRYFGVQFHPEVNHSPRGKDILANFLFKVCGCVERWTPAAFIDDSIAKIREKWATRVFASAKRGVDSAVAGALIHRAIGEQLVSVFVDHGMLRQGEAEQVVRVFREEQGMRLIAVNSVELFLDALSGVTEPEAKRKTIGRLFINVFSAEARKLQGIRFLAQGTIYPDVNRKRRR